MTKTIEEAAREASVSYCSKFAAHQEPYEIAHTEFLNGAGYVMSLPLSQRLTDEERERVRTIYSEAQGWLDEKPTSDSYNSCLRICAVTIQDRLESIFGKELFGEE